MKNKIRGGIIQDFLLLTLAFLTVSFFILGARRLLYRSTPSSPVRISVMTEMLDPIYSGRLGIGDALYDTLTKVRLGEIEEISVIDSDDGIRYVLTFTARCEPRGDALRTSRLWFGYTRI